MASKVGLATALKINLQWQTSEDKSLQLATLPCGYVELFLSENQQSREPVQYRNEECI